MYRKGTRVLTDYIGPVPSSAYEKMKKLVEERRKLEGWLQAGKRDLHLIKRALGND